MLITPSNISALFVAWDTKFAQGYKEAPEPFAEKIATKVPSATRSTTYAWSGKVPVMREWLGERQAQNLESYGYTIENKPYELTLEVDRNDLEDDQYGVYSMHLDLMAIQAKKWPDYLLVDLLQAGETTNCFDGQYFFDTDHPVKKNRSDLGTQQNYWASSKALSADNYASVRAAMMAFKGEDGKPLGVRPNLLVVPPQLEQTARVILHADMIAVATGQSNYVGSQTNVLKGSAELLVVPELANESTAWYLLDTSKPIRPFVFQLRQAPQFVYRNQLTDENVFNRRKFQFGVDARGNAGYGLWFLASKAVA